MACASDKNVTCCLYTTEEEKKREKTLFTSEMPAQMILLYKLNRLNFDRIHLGDSLFINPSDKNLAI